jgi:hypothetical protein
LFQIQINRPNHFVLEQVFIVDAWLGLGLGLGVRVRVRVRVGVRVRVRVKVREHSIVKMPMSVVSSWQWYGTKEVGC